MKRRLIVVVVVALVLAGLAAGAALAAPGSASKTGHLYLYEKNPADWSIVDDGAWGKMTYKLSGPKFNFVFNGHDLVPAAEYTLIYYKDPWPGTGGQCLGADSADAFGNVHIAGRVSTGTLTDAKIWLVRTSDVACGTFQMIGWNPTLYLFEYKLITYTAT